MRALPAPILSLALCSGLAQPAPAPPRLATYAFGLQRLAEAGKLVAGAPAVRHGLSDAESHTWWVAKGVLP